MTESTNNQSEVDIILDRNFKEFIKELKVNKWELIKSISIKCLNRNYMDYEEAISEQKKLREYIIKNQHKINFKTKRVLREGTPTSMPNFFFIFACYTLPNIHEVFNFDDVNNKIKTMCEETNFITFCELINSNEYENMEKCCCSHSCKVKNLFLFENKMTKLRFLTGCDCVKKSKLIGESVIDKAIKKQQKIKNEHKKHMINIKKLLLEMMQKNEQKQNLVNWIAFTKLSTIIKQNEMQHEIVRMQNAFSKFKNLIPKCIECKNQIMLLDYKKCLIKNCDCKFPPLRNKYCYKCANVKFQKKNVSKI